MFWIIRFINGKLLSCHFSNEPTQQILREREREEATKQEFIKTNIANKSNYRRTASVDLNGELEDESKSVQSFSNNDGKIHPVVKKRQSDFEFLLLEVQLMEENKIQTAELILNKTFSSKQVSIADPSVFFHILDNSMSMKVSFFGQFTTADRKY